jgi:hypothetical protein
MWTHNNILELVNMKKWEHLTDSQKRGLLAQIKIWIAIHYLIILNMSGYPIEHQINLLQKFYEQQPELFYPMKLFEVVDLYFRFKPMMSYYLYLNYVIANRFPKKSNSQHLSRTTQKYKHTSNNRTINNRTINNRTINNRTTINRHSKTRTNNKMKGGYLFMLTSRGEKPIRGVDMERFLEKMDDSIQNISWYLPTAGPNTEEDRGNPFNGFALLYFLARNKMSDAWSYALPYAGEYLNIFNAVGGIHQGSTRKYTTLLNLWQNLQAEAQKVDSKQSMEEEYTKNYEKFIRKYINRSELESKKDDYKKYLNEVLDEKKKSETENKLFNHYARKHPPPESKLNDLRSKMSVLDTITMFTGLLPFGK